ncbi:MAG: hypothetical protein HY706_14115 [Candidatus Hydrogenedentes bacterium]|nr:hypothetical protein [Candidatus Hydrogenedentota bacterium]
MVILAALASGLAVADPPVIKKLGTIDCDLVETTPVVFHGKLYRFEYVRENYKRNQTGKSYFRFMDAASGQPTPSFAMGYHLGCAYVEGETVYAYGVDRWGGETIQAFRSTDLGKWSSQEAIRLPGWGIYNTSVCKSDSDYVMAIEIGEPPEEVGVRFTIRFARSKDLLNWQITPSDCVYARDKYTACPALRFVDGWFYMIYLEAKPGPRYAPHIVRSTDLVHWESGITNPIMEPSDEDKRVANPRLTVYQREHIAKAANVNNSDVDFCDVGDRTVIYYSWGNQQGTEFLAEAVYEGSSASLLRSCFLSAETRDNLP